MFVSNTAAVMIMIPIGLAIIKEANELKDDDVKSDSISKFEKSLVLAIGYSGTIGGLGTLEHTSHLQLIKFHILNFHSIKCFTSYPLNIFNINSLNCHLNKFSYFFFI